MGVRILNFEDGAESFEQVITPNASDVVLDSPILTKTDAQSCLETLALKETDTEDRVSIVETNMGDMKKAIYDTDNNGVIDINAGGTGNSDGYIRTGLQVNTMPGARATAEGWNNVSIGIYGHAEGFKTESRGNATHAEGSDTKAEGDASHAEGYQSKVTGSYSHAEGAGTTADGEYCHAEGFYTHAIGDGSHAEGTHTQAYEDYTHAEGAQTLARGRGSHAEGYKSEATGLYSHAEGSETTSSGDYSHAGGTGVTAVNNGEFIQGSYGKDSSNGQDSDFSYFTSAFGWSGDVKTIDSNETVSLNEEVPVGGIHGSQGGGWSAIITAIGGTAVEVDVYPEDHAEYLIFYSSKKGTALQYGAYNLSLFAGTPKLNKIYAPSSGAQISLSVPSSQQHIAIKVTANSFTRITFLRIL